MHSHLLGIDWGSSNRRAYLIDRTGRIVASHSDAEGMLAVRGHFPEAMASLIETMGIADGVPVVMSGMVGSAQGWREVPYLGTNIALTDLPRYLYCIDDPALAGRAAFIVPGYCQRQVNVDVMRGEETQLLGAVAQGRRDGWVVLPGTHSKWVLLKDGAIERFSTFMTGELFATISAGGTLAPLIAASTDEKADDGAFTAGLAEARRRAPLSNALFGVRARVVAGVIPAAQARDFVSGLLIGAEFVAAHDLNAPASVALLGSPALTARYAHAAALFGMQAESLDAETLYSSALQRFFTIFD